MTVCMSLIFRNQLRLKMSCLNLRMYKLNTKFVKTPEMCKNFSKNLVKGNESGNTPRRGNISTLGTVA